MVTRRQRRTAKVPRQAKAPRHLQSIPKEPLAREIRRLVAEKNLSQTAAAAVVQDAPSQLSLLLSGKLRGFSADRLVRTLLRLGRDVQIVVKPAARPQRPGRASVTVITTADGRRR